MLGLTRFLLHVPFYARPTSFSRTLSPSPYVPLFPFLVAIFVSFCFRRLPALRLAFY